MSPSASIKTSSCALQDSRWKSPAERMAQYWSLITTLLLLGAKLDYEFLVTEWQSSRAHPLHSWAFLCEEPWDAFLHHPRLRSLWSLLSSQDAPGTAIRNVLWTWGRKHCSPHLRALHLWVTAPKQCEEKFCFLLMSEILSYLGHKIHDADYDFFFTLVTMKACANKKFTYSQNSLTLKVNQLVFFLSSTFTFYFFLFFGPPHSDPLFLFYNVWLQVTL